MSAELADMSEAQILLVTRAIILLISPLGGRGRGGIGGGGEREKPKYPTQISPLSYTIAYNHPFVFIYKTKYLMGLLSRRSKAEKLRLWGKLLFVYSFCNLN